ncbi:MAG: DNA-binding protein WhiA [Exiguobacterium sp.]|nr:DNA-binding protein WhiA [Exiguobacterium sp.]
MSFASDVKKELTQLEVTDAEAKAELSALVRMNGVISLALGRGMTLDVSTENASIARRIYSLMKRLYDHPLDLFVRKKMRLKKNNVYIVRVSQHAETMLRDLEILGENYEMIRTLNSDMTGDENLARAYLRGAFLAGGSINHPKTSSYHLEIYSLYENHNQALRDLANRFELNAKTLERKKGHILYMKESEKISDFLKLIGATRGMLEFEDARIIKDMRNSVNRLVNCEMANLNKTVGATLRQVENIKFLERTVGLDVLPKKLREIAELRVTHQDVSLQELGEMLESGPISKSGINHRLRKIDQIAERVRSGDEIASS